MRMTLADLPMPLVINHGMYETTALGSCLFVLGLSLECHHDIQKLTSSQYVLNHSHHCICRYSGTPDLTPERKMNPTSLTPTRRNHRHRRRQATPRTQRRSSQRIPQGSPNLQPQRITPSPPRPRVHILLRPQSPQPRR